MDILTIMYEDKLKSLGASRDDLLFIRGASFSLSLCLIPATFSISIWISLIFLIIIIKGLKKDYIEFDL